MNINTESVRQLKDVRRFLSAFRQDYPEYDRTTRLEHQAISNTIALLYDKLKKLDDTYIGDDN